MMDMKRFYLILVALTGSLSFGACEELPDLELETSIGIYVGDNGSNGNSGGNGNGGSNGGITISIGVDKEPPEDDLFFNYEEILSIDSSIGSEAQGGDCWGDYFFQFTSNNTKVRIFDLAHKKFVKTTYIQSGHHGFVSNCHSNTVCFGTEYYAPEDMFPLIYVSTGYASDGYTGALVYRITKSYTGSFSFSLVQTIKFPKMESSWTEFIPAGDCAYLCYTSNRIIYKMKMPELKDGDVILDPADAMESYQFTPQPAWMGSSSNQDRLFYQGMIVYVTGVPQGGQYSGLVMLNLEERKRERTYNFIKNGLTSEPESVFVWQGDLCVAFKDRIVKLTF